MTDLRPDDLRVERVGWPDPGLVSLRAAQEAEVAARYADLPGAGPDRLDPATVLAAWLARAPAGEAVGCAVLTTGPEADGYPTGELKRLYVRPDRRGLRIAARLTAAVLDGAEAAGCRRVVLATGPRQPEALASYRRDGWRRIPNYGPHAATAGVQCFERVLWADPPPLPDGLPVRHRRSARTLVFDPADRLLLTHNRMRTADGGLREHWALPGGGIEPGETPDQTAVREVSEETGLTDVTVAGPVERQQFWVASGGGVLHQTEELWWGRTAQTQLTRRGLHADEDYLVGLRWWTLTELRSGRAATFPRLLGDLAESLLRHGTPHEPFEITSDSTVPPGRPVAEPAG